MKSIVKGICLSLTFILLSSCCTIKPSFIVSPSRIKVETGDAGKHVASDIAKFRQACREHQTCSKDLSIIAHGAGSYRYYGMTINDEGGVDGNNWLFKRAKAENTSTLIEHTFLINSSNDINNEFDIDAVEIDVHIPNETHRLCDNNQPCSFIIHDAPSAEQWNILDIAPHTEAFRYAEQNKTVSILKDFIKKGYPEKNKMLYLEIKANKDCMLPGEYAKECDKPLKRIAAELLPIIKNNNSPRKWLSFVSFSANALEELNKIFSDHKVNDKVNFAFIAGFDNPGWLDIKETLAQCKGAVPHFDDRMQNFVIDNSWIDTVWFSPRVISEPAKIFKDIVKKRNDIKFSISTYDSCAPTFEDSLESLATLSLPKISSMMVDIDNFPQSAQPKAE